MARRMAHSSRCGSLKGLLLALALVTGLPAYASGQQGAPAEPVAPAPTQPGAAESKQGENLPVSYTHLTLPTN